MGNIAFVDVFLSDLAIRCGGIMNWYNGIDSAKKYTCGHRPLGCIQTVTTTRSLDTLMFNRG